MAHRVIVVGAGRMGRNHVRTVQENPRFQLIAVVDPRRPALPGVTVVDELAQVTEPYDVAIVAAPTTAHHALGLRLLELGKDVLLEKPLASTAAQARELHAVATRLGRKL